MTDEERAALLTAIGDAWSRLVEQLRRQFEDMGRVLAQAWPFVQRLDAAHRVEVRRVHVAYRRRRRGRW